MSSFVARMREVREANARCKNASLVAITDALMTDVNASMHRFVADKVTFSHITPVQPLCGAKDVEQALFQALQLSGHGVTLDAKIYPPSVCARDFVDDDVEDDDAVALWRVEATFRISDLFSDRE